MQVMNKCIYDTRIVFKKWKISTFTTQTFWKLHLVEKLSTPKDTNEILLGTPLVSILCGNRKWGHTMRKSLLSKCHLVSIGKNVVFYVFLG